LGTEVRLQQLIEVAIEDGLRIAGLEVGSVVFDHLVWVLHVAPHLPAEFGRYMLTLQLGPFFGLLP
jgi:hypothetical protein